MLQAENTASTSEQHATTDNRRHVWATSALSGAVLLSRKLGPIKKVQHLLLEAPVIFL